MSIVWSGVSMSFATPQSSRYTSPKSPSMMLAGLRSRWSTPRECAKSTAMQTDEKAVSSLRREKLWSAVGSPSRSSFRILASVRPRRRFIVKYAEPLLSTPRS